MDHAHEWTDRELERLERKIAREYSQAAKEMKAKQAKALKRFEAERTAREKALDSTQEAMDAHRRWLQSQAVRETWFSDMVDGLAESAHKANERAADMVNDHLPKVYAENANRAAFAVDKAVRADTRFALVNEDAIRYLMGGMEQGQLVHEVTLNPEQERLAAGLQSMRRDIDAAKDIRWNRQKFASALTQGILQGESIPNIVKRTESIYGMNRDAATRAARTSTTSAENAGRMSSFERAERLGIDMEIEWLATLDVRTRSSHRALDGERIKTGERFSNGLRWPGDPSGPGEELWNCRCRADGRVVGFDGERGDWADEAGERWARLPKGITYEDWKKAKAVTRAESYGNEAGRVSSAWYAERAADALSGAQAVNSTVFAVEDIGTAPVRPRRADYASTDELEDARIAYRAERAEFDARREALIDGIASQPGRGYGTEQAAMEWAESRGVLIQDDVFAKVDARALDEAIDVVDRLFDKYPEVQRAFSEHGARYGIRVSDDRSVFMEAGGGLQFNPAYFGNYRDAVSFCVDGYTSASYNDWVGRPLATMVRGDGTFRTSVTHEFGHNLDSAIRDGLDMGRYSEYRRELAELTKKFTTSEYSLVNELEAFAEGFAEMECNPTSGYARAFSEFLTKWR